MFFECSAKSDINIEKIFRTISEQVVKRLSEQNTSNLKQNIRIRKIEPTNKRIKCC